MIFIQFVLIVFQAQSDDGTVGLIPENYIQVLGEDSINGGVTETQSTGYNSVPQSAGYDSVPQSAGYDSYPDSAGYDSSVPSAGYESSAPSSGYDNAGQSFSYNGEPEVQYRVEPPVNEAPDSRVSAYSENDYEVQKTMAEEIEIPNGKLDNDVYMVDMNREKHKNEKGRFVLLYCLL